MHTDYRNFTGARAVFCRRVRPLRRSRARFPLLSPTVTSSPGAGEVFPQRESQGLRLVAKALGEMRKFPAVLLALPLGELSPKVTERAHVVGLVAKVSVAIRNRPVSPEASSQRELATPTALPEGVKSSHAKSPRTQGAGALESDLTCGLPAGSRSSSGGR